MLAIRQQRRPALFRAAATTGAIILLATACGGNKTSDADPAKPVEIGVTVSNATEPYVIPWLVGQEQKFFLQHGVDITEIVPSKGGSTTLRNMLSGDLPIADIGFTSVIESITADAPVVVVGGAVQSAYGLDFYAMADGPVRDIDDAEIWSYTNPESVTQALTYMLPERAGATGDVQRVASGGVGEGIALLESGDVDVTVIPPSILAKDVSRFREIVSSANYLDPFQQSVIATTPKYAQAHPGVIKAVLAAYQQAVDWIAKHPAEAAESYARYSDIEPALAEDIVKQALAHQHWGVGFNAAAIQTAIDAKQLAGGEHTDTCKVFDATYLPEGAATDLPADC